MSEDRKLSGPLSFWYFKSGLCLLHSNGGVFVSAELLSPHSVLWGEGHFKLSNRAIFQVSVMSALICWWSLVKSWLFNFFDLIQETRCAVPIVFIYLFSLRHSLFAVDTLCFSGCRARCARSLLFPTIFSFCLLVLFCLFGKPEKIKDTKKLRCKTNLLAFATLKTFVFSWTILTGVPCEREPKSNLYNYPPTTLEPSPLC